MGAMVEFWRCREALVEIWNRLDPGMMEMQCTFDTYITWKKEFIKLLKDWDGNYMKHVKGTWAEINGIINTAMKPLTDLMESNLNFHYLELIEKKKDVPSFRHVALEEKFAGHLSILCNIFKEYGSLKDKIINIKQMLHVLKTPGWRESPPLAFYFHPLNDAIREVRDCLLKMNEEGILHCKYVLELNEELMAKCLTMVERDFVAQILAGDELKQDQFKFIYKVVKIIYDSALKDHLLNEDPKVVGTVIPKLTAYHSVLLIKGILDTKTAEKKKELEKAEREGRKVTFQAEDEDKKIMTEEQVLQKRMDQKMGQSTAFMTETQKLREMERLEIEKYGVSVAANDFSANVDLGGIHQPEQARVVHGLCKQAAQCESTRAARHRGSPASRRIQAQEGA